MSDDGEKFRGYLGAHFPDTHKQPHREIRIQAISRATFIMASPSPTLADIIVQSSQGPKINPFVDLIRGLDEKQNPPVDDSQTEGLLFSIATYIVVFLVCLAIISLPYLQGAGGHRRRHWVMKRQYLDGRKRSFL
jgi:hypothetical protein